MQFAAFQTLLAAWSGQWDLVTGITTANRALPETEELIGFFVNVLPIRGALSPEESFAAVLVRTGRSLIDAYKRDELPFELLLERLELPRAAGHNPLVQVTVASHQELTAPLSLSGLTVEHLPPRGLDVQEDLTFYLTSGAQGVRGDFAFRTDLFDRSTMEELGRAYLRLLEKAVAGPELTLHRLVEEAAVPAGRTAAEASTDAPEAAGAAPGACWRNWSPPCGASCSTATPQPVKPTSSRWAALRSPRPGSPTGSRTNSAYGSR
ncbi:hypothetical protein SHKM778_48150 [Streptomyces sp. KM77-8]|uniref:Condensation domain-containing protein n=1 Tax=Streptomyces haneummycinicus TaxID=3074435 RepID=A0AAT9HLL3_9ACTN